MEKWTPWEKVAGFDFTDIIYEKKYHREIGGGVARIAFNRQDVYNAFSGHIITEVCQSLDDASHDRSIRVVVITGVGDHFSTGGDVRWEAEGQEGGARGLPLAAVKEAQQASFERRKPNFWKHIKPAAASEG